MVSKRGLCRQNLKHAQALDRSLIASAATASKEVTKQVSRLVEAGSEIDANGVQRLPLRKEGWNFWDFEGNKVHYIQAGTSGTPVVFLHGFGASAYHWRYNIPVLAERHRVFAMDLLGMGWSDKPTGEDIYQVWPRQIAAFIKEVVSGEPVVLVGNSLGGYNCLKASVTTPDLVRGVALLNSAGRFEEVKAEVEAQVEAALPDDEASEDLKQTLRETAGLEPEERKTSNGRASISQVSTEEQPTLIARMTEQLKSMAVRGSIYASFFLAKQPKRIRQVLEQVYISQQNVDEDLVNSILWPSEDPNAAESFYQIISGKGTPVNVLLSNLDKPVLLLWGADDPWIGPGSAARIESLYPRAQKVLLSGVGHCPQDDAPERVNTELMRWLETV
ncbi:probable haloalkane dehalogenase [Coccomyxa sp. Obi]|nr:probable haloalkane dehalogenase [Coccomyxa sp. Obi]